MGSLCTYGLKVGFVLHVWQLEHRWRNENFEFLFVQAWDGSTNSAAFVTLESPGVLNIAASLLSRPDTAAQGEMLGCSIKGGGGYVCW